MSIGYLSYFDYSSGLTMLLCLLLTTPASLFLIPTLLSYCPITDILSLIFRLLWTNPAVSFGKPKPFTAEVKMSTEDDEKTSGEKS